VLVGAMKRSLDELASELTILYQDSDVVVVNKPSGLLVHRGWAQDEKVTMTVVRDLIGQYVWVAHRLDRATSGALVFALNKDAARNMATAFEERRVEKTYVALVRGVAPDEGIIDSQVPKVPKGERVDAETHFRRLWVFENRYSLVEAQPKTGRLHQIRRHLRHITHPLIGDVNYGVGEHNRLFRKRFGLHRLALHALVLQFPHPSKDEEVTVKAPLTEDFLGPLTRMGLPAPLIQTLSES
jgi:tRNA pseudouridine65 synthase